MTLEEFLDQPLTTREKIGFEISEWVDHPDFEGMYVRRCLPKKIFTLSNIEVKNPGRGIFTQFLKVLKTSLQGWTIRIECVQDQRFREYFIRNGFVTYGYQCFQCQVAQ